jgi:hypothetical protein
MRRPLFPRKQALIGPAGAGKLGEFQRFSPSGLFGLNSRFFAYEPGPPVRRRSNLGIRTPPTPSQVFAADVPVVHFEKFLLRHDLQARRQHRGQLRPLPQDTGNRDTQANCPTIAMNAGEFGRTSTRMSPRLIPIRYSIRRSCGMPSLRSAITACTATAHSTASTTDGNSSNTPSGVRKNDGFYRLRHRYSR